MVDEHPLEQLLRDAKAEDDLKASAQVAEQRKAHDLQDRVRSQWLRTRSELTEEIERANAVLEKHNLRERYAFREVPEAGSGNVARGNLTLAYAAKPQRAEYDMTVLAADGSLILLHRTTGQRHQKLTVFTATRKSWETVLIGLYRDHLKKGREPSPNSGEQVSGTHVSVPSKES
jgi:hypothetical protein